MSRCHSSQSSQDSESIASSIESINNDHEDTYDNLLNCFGFRDIINEDIEEIELTEGEALLMDFLKKTESLTVIKQVLQQNKALAKQLADKVYSDTDETCSKCKGK